VPGQPVILPCEEYKCVSRIRSDELELYDDTNLIYIICMTSVHLVLKLIYAVTPQHQIGALFPGYLLYLIGYYEIYM
jgi:hypothetical protein